MHERVHCGSSSILLIQIHFCRMSLFHLSSPSNSSCCVLSDFQKFRRRSHNFWFYLVCVFDIWDLKLPAAFYGRVALPNRMNFWKKFQTAIDPPPSFLENYIANFLWQIWLQICKEIWWLDSVKCMHMISRYRCSFAGRTTREETLMWEALRRTMMGKGTMIFCYVGGST